MKPYHPQESHLPEEYRVTISSLMKLVWRADISPTGFQTEVSFSSPTKANESCLPFHLPYSCWEKIQISILQKVTVCLKVNGINSSRLFNFQRRLNIYHGNSDRLATWEIGCRLQNNSSTRRTRKLFWSSYKAGKWGRVADWSFFWPRLMALYSRRIQTKDIGG